MLDDTFSRPVVFFAEEANGALRHVEMTTVDQGFKALHRGLEGFCLQTPEWHLAFSKLARAKLEPTPERVESARQALEQLANLTRETGVHALSRRLASRMTVLKLILDNPGTLSYVAPSRPPGDALARRR
jgi:hypothetical protein